MRQDCKNTEIANEKQIVVAKLRNKIQNFKLNL